LEATIIISTTRHGFPYNEVGGVWKVNSIYEKTIVLKRGPVGLGVNEDELNKHFRKVSGQTIDEHSMPEVTSKSISKFKTFFKKMFGN